jgi:hypothetical protein
MVVLLGGFAELIPATGVLIVAVIKGSIDEVDVREVPDLGNTGIQSGLGVNFLLGTSV